MSQNLQYKYKQEFLFDGHQAQHTENVKFPINEPLKRNKRGDRNNWNFNIFLFVIRMNLSTKGGAPNYFLQFILQGKSTIKSLENK